MVDVKQLLHRHDGRLEHVECMDGRVGPFERFGRLKYVKRLADME